MSRLDKEMLLFCVGIFATIIAVIALAVWACVADARAWREFARTHDCKVTARVRGDTFNTFGVSPNGRVTVGVGSTPDKTGYTCNDGITYYR
jgi:hypothetical protein